MECMHTITVFHTWMVWNTRNQHIPTHVAKGHPRNLALIGGDGCGSSALPTQLWTIGAETRHLQLKTPCPGPTPPEILHLPNSMTSENQWKTNGPVPV